MKRSLVFAHTARVLLALVCLLSAIPATAMASISHPANVGPAAGTASSPSHSVSVGRHVPLSLLQSLLSTPQGRALLRGGLDSGTLQRMERRYGTTSSRGYFQPSPLIKVVPSERDLLPGVTAHAPPAAPHPSFTLQAPAVPVASRVRGTLRRFVPGDTVTILFDGRPFTHLRLSRARQAPARVPFALPARTAGGLHTITAVGLSSGRATATLRVYTVRTSQVTLAGGRPFVISGSGFLAGQVVTVSLRSRSGPAIFLGYDGTDAYGALVPLHATLPLTATAGPATIVVRDSADEQAGVAVRVRAAVGQRIRHAVLPGGRNMRARGHLVPHVVLLSSSTNLYVNNSSASASDSNPCTAVDAPCLTIGGALGKAAPGDVVNIAGGLYNETFTISRDVTISGTANGETVIDGSGLSGSVITVTAGTRATIYGVTVQNGAPAGSGYASYGGGIKNSGDLSVTASTVTTNNASRGAGIYNDGTLLLRNSTIDDNVATGSNQGGGIYNAGTLTAVNSTISLNTGSASGGEITGGGAIVNDATASLYSSTIVSNTAGGGDGGIRNNSSSPVTLTNTILAGNTNSGLPADCSGGGLIASGGYNLVSDGTCGLTDGVNGDQIGTSAQPLDAKLSVLQVMGGPTRTQLPLPGSPAVDRGNPAGCLDNTGAALTTDERGYPRPYPAGGRCDVGAVEAQYPTVTGVTPLSGPPVGGTTVVISGTGFNFLGSNVSNVTSIAFGPYAVCPSCYTVDPSGTLITATSPAATGSGPVDVAVTTREGSSPITTADQFFYGTPPSSTPVLPTATNTPVPPTATATDTPLPPTSTNTPLPPTATRTNTPVPPTATPTNTPIPPTATNTATPTNTGTPLPTSTVPAGDCFHATVAGWQFLATACPSNGQATNVQVIPPSGLTLQVAISPLPSLALNGSNLPLLPLTLPDLTISLDNYMLSAKGNVLDSTGLTIGTASLTLPSSFGGLGLSASSVFIGANGTISGTVALTPQTLSFSLGSFSFSATNIMLSQTGVSVDSLSLTLPASVAPPGSNGTLTATNVFLNADGSFGGTLTLPDTNISLDGFTIGLHGLALSRSGISIASANLTLPASLSPQGNPPIALNGSNLALGFDKTITGTLSASGLQLAVAGFSVNTGSLTLDRVNGLQVSGVSLSLNSAGRFFPNGAPTLTGNFSISPSFAISGSISTGPISLTVAGFTLATDGITLDTTNGLQIANATLPVPASLLPAGVAPFSLVGNLQITPAFTVSGSIAISPVDLSLGGFALHANSISFDNAGLHIVQASLSLGTLSSQTLTAPSIDIGTDGAVSGTIALTPGDFSLTYGGFGVELKGISLSHVAGGLTSLGVGTLLFTVPSDILPAGVPNTLTVSNVQINSDGTLTNGGISTGTTAHALPASRVAPHAGVSGLNLPPFSVSLAGFTASVNGVVLGLHGLSIGDAELGVPASMLPQGAGPVTVKGALTITRPSGQRTSISGSLSTGPISLSLASFSISTDGLTLDSTNGLQVSNARIALTAASSFFPNGVPTLTGNLSISPSFKVIGSLSTGAVSLAVAGFTVGADAITLSTTNGLQVSNARLSLTGASSLFPNGAPTLSGNFTISPSFALSGTLSTGAISIAMGGFTLSSDGIILDTTDGLQVTNARLSLAGTNIPFFGTPPTLTGNLSISPSFKITGSLSTGQVSFTIAGFTVGASGMTLGNTGLTITGPQLILPTSLFSGPTSGAAGVTVAFTGSLQITPHFTISGHLSASPQGLGITFGGTTLSVASIVFDSDTGLSVQATYTLPGSLGGGTLQGNLVVSPSFQVSGSVELDAPQFSLQSFSARANRISLDSTGKFSVQNIQVSVPLGAINLGTPTISGNLVGTIGAHGVAVAGVLTLGNLPQFTYGGFDASVSSIELDVSGGNGTPITTSVVARGFQVQVALPGGAPLTFGGDVAIAVGQSPQLEIDNSFLTYGGFFVSVQQFLLTSSGVSINGASLSMPIGPNGRTLTLVGALSVQRVNGQTEVTGFLQLPNTQISVAGITVDVTDLRLDTNGLSIESASVNVNGDSPLAAGLRALNIPLQSIAINGLRISTNFTISGGVVSINGSDTLTVATAGASLTIGRVSILPGAVSIGTLSVTLPAIFGGSTLNVNDVLLDRNGLTITQSLSFSLADFSVSASSISIQRSGFKVTGVSFTLPIIQGAISVGDMGYDGHKLTIADLPLPTSFKIPDLKTGQPIATDSQKAACANSGGTYLPLPPINAGGFSVNGAACLSFGTDGNGHTTYLVVGQGSVSLADIGSLSCEFELGSPNDTFPYVFHHAVINVEFVEGLPIDETGLEINGIIGGIGITQGADHNPIYSLEVGADFQSDDGGYLLNGNLRLNFATDGNFGIGGTAQLLRLLTVSGGFCVRIVDTFDFVCQGSLPDPTFADQAAHGLGLYAQVTASLSATLNETAYLSFDIRGHIWVDQDGPELAASASVAANLPSDFISPGLPPCGASANASAQIGKFYNNGGKVFGVKADFDAHICPVDITWGVCSISCSHTHTDFHISAGIFIDDNGNVHLDDSGYTLIEGQNRSGYMLARLANGSTLLSRLATVVPRAAPGHNPTLSAARLSGVRRGGPLAAGAQPAANGAGLRQALSIAVTGAQSSETPQAPTYANVATVSVLPGQTDALFSLRWQCGAPHMTLVAPNGQVYDPTHIGRNALPGDPRDFVPYHLTTGLPAGDVAADAIYIPHPQIGLWHVTIANLNGNEGYKLQVHMTTPPPALAVTAPAAGQTLVAQPTVTLRGTLAGNATPGNDTIALYYTAMPTVHAGGKTVPNYAGTLIAANVPVVNGRWSYKWDTSSLPSGTYYVYASLEDGAGAAVNGYARGQVRVVQPARPDAPRSAVATEGNGQFDAMWSPPVRAGIVRGYRLRWRTNALPAGRYYVLDLGESTTFTLNEAQRGARYSAEVADYDLSDHQSSWTPIAVTSGASRTRRPVDFRLTAGRAAGQAGGFVSIPLSLRPIGSKASHGASDFVALSVSGQPAGMIARPTLAMVNLFTSGTGAAMPAIHVFTAATLRPGVYPLLVTARQDGTGRIHTVRAVLTVLSGSPSTVQLSARAPHLRADGMMEQAITARVVDGSGFPVSDGTATLHFSASDGTFAPDRAAVVGGIVRTTLVYVAGTHPIITADAGTTLGRLYLGPTPAGASRDRFFAATTGRAAQAATRRSRAIPAINEDIVLRNPLAADASARLTVTAASRTGGAFTTQVLFVPVPAGGTAVEHLATLVQDGRPVGVEVQSDLPLIATRVVSQPVAHGKAKLLGGSAGLDRLRASYRFTLPEGQAVVNLYNPGTGPRLVVITAMVAGLHKAVTVRQCLSAPGVTQVDVGALIAAEVSHLERQSSTVSHGPRSRTRRPTPAVRIHVHGPVAVTVSANAPLVVEKGP